MNFSNHCESFFSKRRNEDSLTTTQIERMIYLIRGHKVMLDSDLAELYGVETKSLKRAVKRNIERFPSDFIFELTKKELADWRYQFGTSNREKMGLRIPPDAFSEGGIAMLSSVLTSIRVVEVNISIMRIFIKMRSFLAMESGLTERVGELEKGTNQLFKSVFERLDNLEDSLRVHPKDRKKIGIYSKDN